MLVRLRIHKMINDEIIEKKSKQNIGNAGEFYFAAILSAKDFVVTVTLGRNEGYDLIAVNKNGKPIKISVKARNLKEVKRFPLNVKDETYKGEDFFYAFVRLNEFKEEPDYWIVPSKIVSNVVKSSHDNFMLAPNKEGGKHNDGDIRNFWLVNNKYYPFNWEEELKKYYKNLDQLK